MTFNDTAIFILVMFCGALLVGVVIFAGGVAFSYLADAKPITEDGDIDARPERKVKI